MPVLVKFQYSARKTNFLKETFKKRKHHAWLKKTIPPTEGTYLQISNAHEAWVPWVSANIKKNIVTADYDNARGLRITRLLNSGIALFKLIPETQVQHFARIYVKVTTWSVALKISGGNT